jgi:methylmalonyl-CoA mutase N-terminal domain/subunit
MDEALGLPTEKAARIALRTQQILAEESGIANTIDPFAGSYYVEWLTDKLEQEAWKLVAQIEAMGGMLAAIERGWVQREIHESAYRAQRALEAHESVVVGVNDFVQGNDATDVEILKVDPAVERDQVARLKAFKARRDAAAVKAVLARVRETARGTENLMPVIVDAVKAHATVGEICHALRAEWGEYRPPAEV